MAVDAQAGAKVMFENPLDTLNAIAKVPNAKAAAPLEPMIFPVVLTLQDVQPILKGVGKMMYVGDATWLYFLKPVRTPVAILGSLGVCIYVPASRHWLISYSPVHLN